MSDYTYQKRRAGQSRAVQDAPAPAAPLYRSFPNSAFPAASVGGMGREALREAMRKKMAALHRQIPSAEAEADRLSKGVTGTTPERVRSEMGERMGADFSGVRFHSDAASASRAEEMGTKAWTQGNDVYFGAGGFEPSVAAHELVHTVQQGAVSGGVSTVSAPMGGVQMFPPDDDKKPAEPGKPDNQQNQQNQENTWQKVKPVNIKKTKQFLQRPETLRDNTFTGTTSSGSVNTAYKYQGGWYKSTDNGKQKIQENDSVMRDAGVKLGSDGWGFESRNLAATELDKMLGTNVLVNAKRARVGDSTLGSKNSTGVLMENAPGVAFDKLNWKAFTPQFMKVAAQNPKQAGGWTAARPAAAQVDTNDWVKREYRDKTDASKGMKTFQEKFDQIGQKRPGVKFTGWNRETVNVPNAENAGLEALDIADPALQKSMSDMYIMDKLMNNPDRHGGNFKIDFDKQTGKFNGVKGIDNDASFGIKSNIYDSNQYMGGLPDEMHIDAGTAAKILGTSDEELEKRFGRLISPKEVQALKARFHHMQEYITRMMKIDEENAKKGNSKRLIVQEWNDQTALEQLMATEGRGDEWNSRSKGTYYQSMIGSLAEKRPKKREDYMVL